MFKAVTAVLLVLLPLSVLAQSGTPVKKNKKVVQAASRAGQRTAPARVPAPPVAAVNQELSAEQLAVAPQVYVGRLPCELGAAVTVLADPAVPGHFDVRLANKTYRMVPVATSTGAIRLEDRAAGTVWLQLSNKSMLMNAKLGKRLVDACMNPDQITVAHAMKTNPAPSVLDEVSGGIAAGEDVAVALRQVEE